MPRSPSRSASGDDIETAGAPSATAQAASASHRVYLGILQDLEHHRLAPGDRLTETELATRFGVGRNAVREAMQRLAMRGVVDLSPNRSASIRRLNMKQISNVLDVAAEITSLLARTAARCYSPAQHADMLDAAMRSLADSEESQEIGAFSRARRRFYRTLLAIGENEEMSRLFPAISMHIIYSQFQSNRLLHVRLADYRAIFDTVRANDVFAAAAAGRAHVEHVRQIIEGT